MIEDVYRWLPLGTIVNNRVFVVHGGISENTDLDIIRNLDRGKVKAHLLIGQHILCSWNKLQNYPLLLQTGRFIHSHC